MKYPCRKWYLNHITIIIQACIILHNMIIEDKKVNGDYEDEFAQLNNNDNVNVANNGNNINQDILNLPERLNRIAVITDSVAHLQLRNDLVEHLWSIHGDLN